MSRPQKWIWALVVAAAATPALAQEPNVQDLWDKYQALQSRVKQQDARIAELETGKTAAAQGDLLAALKELEGKNSMKVFWKEGLRLESYNGLFSLRIGGRVMFDMGWSSDDDGTSEANIGDQLDWFEFRRARLYTQGEIYGNIKYKLQLDFADGSLSTKDAYIQISTKGHEGLNMFVDALKVGHFKEPFSLNELTSSKYIMFIERATPVGIWAPSRNPGAQISKFWKDCQAGYAFGIFKTAGDGEADYDDAYALTGRVTWAPWYENGGEQLLHVGGSYSYRNNQDEAGGIRYRTRGPQHIGNRPLDSGTINGVESTNLMGAEAAMVYGPFSVQGEYLAAALAGVENDDDRCFSGGYVQASYFLTGEHRPYKKGTFSRVKPKQNFGPDGGWGAWEVAARWSYTDIDDGSAGQLTSPGDVNAVTLGVNWYLNPNTRIMLNYIRSCWDIEGATPYQEDIDTFIVRFQVDF
jgi:phosphate-selective porin OprO/OprP